ncbi:receptor-type tyrosine-protein phosphatase T-like [Physella acuta]|uniref:receptor-type tyrosine-protein phosphatase T-like n=1 Tax=Physella acuta TaxID=109671 RepID=UPI0027DC2B8E|nr:receptor-type tyrosine-protein phosphatase T-like [Physella acuta]
MADKKWLWTFLILLTLGLRSVCGKCERGFFGWKCKLSCKNCIDEECDEKTLTCNSGCKTGYYGDHCLFENQCQYDSSGITYTGHLNVAQNKTSCVAWNLVQNFNDLEFEYDDDPGNFCRNPKLATGRLNKLWCYTSPEGANDLCDIKLCDCPTHLFGEGCKRQCHCNENSTCDRNGFCSDGCADGWVGAQCSRKCHPGFYGNKCKKECVNCVDKQCNHETGKCNKGCKAGYMGDRCQLECDKTYGPNCANKCGHCRDDDICDRFTGRCLRGCSPGYISSDNGTSLCDLRCKNSYGLNCINKCGACLQDSQCDVVTGVCSHGCQDGYTSDKCDTTCPDFYYGKNCSQKCGLCKNNSSCDPFTGRCWSGCLEGHTGFECIQKMKEESSIAFLSIGAGLGGAAGFIILILIFCLIYRQVQHRRHKTLHVPRHKMSEIEDVMTREESCQLLEDSRVGSEPPSCYKEDDDKTNGIQEPIYVNVNSRKQTSPVLLSDLHSYILKHKEHSWEGFKREFEELPMGLLAQCEIARRPENKVKNRYGNIVAYDHSRVILDPLPNEPFSDYVNANFMDGYAKPRAYIASQGPNKIMIRDFWRMVWQHKVSKIVMLTNLMEACKKKCEQYWPDEGSQKYGELTVLLVNVTKYSDFIIRTFELSKEMENSRIVKQFHFTTWSDHGAPTYPTTLLSFRRKVINFKPDDSAPILSHCSAGIGRTGTFIALNYLLEQAVAENQVDVLRCAQLMRANRVNMIQTLEQYVFVYEAVLEALLAGNTTIPRSSFHSTYEEMLTPDGDEIPRMEKQHDVLQLLSPTIERDECSTAFQEENMAKNRFKNILPANRTRPYLYTPVEGCNEYINAVYLSGYTQKDQFIVTQMPLPTTVADFWRMLYDTSSDTIVMLNEFDRNDKSCALYWPEEYGYSEEHGPLNVELLSSSEVDPDVTVRVFKLSHTEKGEERAIKQFMFKSWPDYQTTPNSVTPLLRLYRQVTDWLKQNSKGPVTVHCMNGASKSGVFVASCLLLERLELDYEVDVYQTVKQIRINRPQLIENLEQYKFLYQVVQEYMDQE